MTSKPAFVLILSGIALLSCARNRDLDIALMPAAGLTEVVSRSPTEAAQQWQRAQFWVASHANLKIQTATDVIVQTYGAWRYDADYSFLVLREALIGGDFRITIRAACGSFFGCSPGRNDVSEAFYYYVISGKDLLAGFHFDGIR